MYCVRLTETCHCTCMLLLFCWFWFDTHTDKICIAWMHCKSLWIKASAKWLKCKCKYKILMFSYKTTGAAPIYLNSLVQTYAPSRSLHSASERRLVVPSQRGTKSLSQPFSWTVPSWWNDLPISIRIAESLAIFRKHLKTHIFRQHLTNYY